MTTLQIIMISIGGIAAYLGLVVLLCGFFAVATKGDDEYGHDLEPRK